MSGKRTAAGKTGLQRRAISGAAADQREARDGASAAPAPVLLSLLSLSLLSAESKAHSEETALLCAKLDMHAASLSSGVTAIVNNFAPESLMPLLDVAKVT